MYSKMVSLRFPKSNVNEPIISNLAKRFDLTFNILKATIYPRKEGLVVMELLDAIYQSAEQGAPLRLDS